MINDGVEKLFFSIIDQLPSVSCLFLIDYLFLRALLSLHNKVHNKSKRQLHILKIYIKTLGYMLQFPVYLFSFT